MNTSGEIVKSFLDISLPDIGRDSSYFAAMVVVLSAAIMNNAGVQFLQEFTGYRKEFIEAIANNMVNNGLWVNDVCVEASWLRKGFIQEPHFVDQVSAAMGELWFSEEAVKRPTVAVLWIEP